MILLGDVACSETGGGMIERNHGQEEAEET
jgi:hypothetical protein